MAIYTKLQVLSIKFGSVILLDTIMEIQYLGHSSFRIKGKNVTVVTDPYDSTKVGLKFPKVDATIVTSSHDHDDHNLIAQVEGSHYDILGPGEYEIGGTSIFGISSFHDDKQGEERGRNTIYVFNIDGIVVCHLGDLGHKLSEEQIGEIGNVDVLLVPVGGVYTIDASLAANTVSQLEPKIVIPMHYKADGLKYDLEPVENFIKEMGIEPIKDSKFSITSDKLPEEIQLVVLEKR